MTIAIHLKQHWHDGQPLKIEYALIIDPIKTSERLIVNTWQYRAQTDH